MGERTRDGKVVKPLSVYVSEELWARLCAYCKANGVTKTFVVERSVGRYLDEVSGSGADGERDVVR